MEEKNEEAKKIKNLKIAKAVLTAIAGASALVKEPIMTGVSIAAGLGSVLLGTAIDCNEVTMTPAMAK